jgi:hypothetical protein
MGWILWKKGEDCLSPNFYAVKIVEFRSPHNIQPISGNPQGDVFGVSFLLGYFFFGQAKKKYLAHRVKACN